jgi:hypothetical protein
MKKTIIDITGQIELTYDENSPEFKEALKSYREVIEKEGTKESMLKHIAFYVTRFGIDGMVDGVGYIGFNGRKPSEDYSGIMISEDYDEFNFDIR